MAKQLSPAAAAVAALCDTSDAELKQAGDQAIYDDVGLIKAILRVKGYSFLAGVGAEEVAQVQEWLSVYATRLRGRDAPKDVLERLDAHLASATYLVANRLTVADVVIFAAVHAAVAARQKAGDLPVNITRWFDNVQALPQLAKTRSVLPLINIAIPASSLFSWAAPVVTEAKAATKPAAAGAAAAAAPKGEAKADGKAGKKDKAAAPKAESKGETKEAAAAAPAAGAGAAAPKADGAKKGGKGDAAAAKAEAKKPAAAEEKKGGAAPKAGEGKNMAVSRCDLRVARVVSVDKHPTEARMYVYGADLGDGKAPRVVVSSVADIVAADAFKGMNVVLLINQKAANIKGVDSCGARLLVATAGDKKAIITAPAGAKAGESVTFAGVESKPDDVINNKHFSSVQKELKTSGAGVAQFAGIDFATSAGACSASGGLPGAAITF